MKEILKYYIKKLSINDIKNYCKKNNIQACDNDLNTILFYIKNYWEKVFDGDTSIFEEIREKIDPNSYQTMMMLYNDYKKFL